MEYYTRNNTRQVSIGAVKIGGGHPIAIQSMCNTDTRDVKKTVAQIKVLETSGCEIIRVAVPDLDAATALKQIKKQISIPLVADIHFDYRLALAAMENGVDKLRINPGNIGSIENVKKVVCLAKEKNIPIRIGVNAGSLEKHLIEKYNGVCVDALVESALGHVRILEDLHYENIVVALKSSSVVFCIEAYEKISAAIPYPLHVGITESGTVRSGGLKSAVGIGSILSRGIGDTIRVSLTGDPVEEVLCAKQILQALDLRTFGVTFVSCPTCGRTEIDMITLANKVEAHCKHLTKNIKIAVMGCVVNGPGEARDADIGIAGGKDCGIIFKKGQLLRKVDQEHLLEEFLLELDRL